MSYNKWAYTYGNPINLSDPTGMRPEDRGYCDSIAGNRDQVKCEQIVRGIDPIKNSNWTMSTIALWDAMDLTPACPLYMTLPVPAGGDRSLDYGLWFHYMLNAKAGKPVKISTVIAYALAAEAGVPSIYSAVMPKMVQAMAVKSQLRGVYTALGSRQVVMKDIDPFLFKNGSVNIWERNQKVGVPFWADVLGNYIHHGRNWAADLERHPDLLTKVEEVFPIPISIGNPNMVPDDWGNSTSLTLGLPIESKLKSIPYDSTVINDANDQVYWRSNPRYASGGLDQFFIVTPNQAHNLCPPNSVCH
jgi:hypothetical protein